MGPAGAIDYPQKRKKPGRSSRRQRLFPPPARRGRARLARRLRRFRLKTAGLKGPSPRAEARYKAPNVAMSGSLRRTGSIPIGSVCGTMACETDGFVRPFLGLQPRHCRHGRL